MSTADELTPPSDALGHRAGGTSGGGRFSNRELATIAMLAALHFAVSFAARLLGGVLYVFLGPWSVYADGIAGEGVPCLLLAAAVTLVPRVGTAALTILTVWLLNAVVTGTFTFVSILQVSVSLAVHELILFLCGATNTAATAAGSSPPATPTDRLFAVLRTATAVGTTNAAALYVQFFLSIELYELMFPAWYIHSVALLTGFGYGSIGAAIGARWALELQRTAP